MSVQAMMKAFLISAVAISMLAGPAIAGERKASGLRNSDAIEASAARRKRVRSQESGPLVMSGFFGPQTGSRRSRVTADKCVPVKIRVR